MSSADEVASQNGSPDKPTELLESVVIRFLRGQRRRHAARGNAVYQRLGRVRQMTSVRCLIFPRRFAPRPDRWPASAASNCVFPATTSIRPGDEVDTLVAMNPAALKTNVGDLKRGGTLIVNEDAFDKGNVQKAHYDANPARGWQRSGRLPSPSRSDDPAHQRFRRRTGTFAA